MTTLDLSPTPVPVAGPVPAEGADRARAAAVGLSFLAATATFGTADALVAGVLDRPGYLAGISGQRGVLAGGALLALISGIAVVAIAVLMYPVLRRRGQRSLGLAYVAFRVAELAAILAYLAVPLVVLQAGDRLADGAAAEQLEPLFPAQHGAAMLVVYLMSSTGGFMLALAFLRSRLVPRALAVLGVVGYPVLLLGSVLAAFGMGDVSRGPGLLALVPGGLFELLLPLWLLIRGFRTTTSSGEAS